MNEESNMDDNFTCYRTEDLGFILVVLYSETNSSIIYLVDPWKIGIQDCFLFDGNLDNIRHEMNMPELEFLEIEIEKAKYLISLGTKISKAIGKPLNALAETWANNLNLIEISPCISV